MPVGIQDTCYYNYRCAIPYDIFGIYISDVNHIISNFGYMMFGVFFIIIVKYKDHLYKKYRICLVNDEIQKGLPQYFGIFYALGFGLISIGFLSMCYHVCPTNQNFQFDTTFMYVVAILLTLKIYQFRHPDETSYANKIFLGVTFILLLEIIGIQCSEYRNTQDEYIYHKIFWPVVIILYIYIILKMAPILYYSGKWTHKGWNIEFIVSF